MWESAAKPADALGKERGGLGDREVMRFMAMTRQPGNPTDSPLAWAHCSLAGSAPALLLRAPRDFMWGGGSTGDMGALIGIGMCHHQTLSGWVVQGYMPETSPHLSPVRRSEAGMSQFTSQP